MFDDIKIGICVPTAGYVRVECMASFYKIIRLLNEKKLWPEAMSQEAMFFSQIGSQIPTNRESLVNRALEAQCSHILFIDDDMNFDGRAFELMSLPFAQDEALSLLGDRAAPEVPLARADLRTMAAEPALLAPRLPFPSASPVLLMFPQMRDPPKRLHPPR